MNYKEKLNKAKEAMAAARRENLTELVRRYGSIAALAIAVSRPATQVGDMVRGQKPIGDKITRHIETALNLGEGALDRRFGAFSNTEQLSEDESRINRIPILSTVQAGMPTDHGDLHYDEFIEVYGSLPAGCYGLRVKGDSMSPLIDDGDIVIVDTARWPKPGDYIVARSELENLSEATVKRYHPVGFDETGREVFEARPLNPLYPAMHSVSQKLVIVGTVCKLLKDL